MPKPTVERLNDSVLPFARSDFTTLGQDLTIEQALAEIRRQGVGERVIYFYVVDEARRLVGVVPTRRLLMTPLDRKLSDVMIRRVMTVPDTATVLEACECFAMHRFFAFPIVDAERHLVGVVDVQLFTDEMFDLAERARVDEVFESIGFRVSQVRDASPLRAFRFRFPWLLTTILSGTACAWLASAYELTLARSLVLAFFLTLILGLGESVSIQSMTVTIQALRTTAPELRWYLRALRRETITAVLMGAGCGVVVGLIVWIWQGAGMAALAIGLSILLALCTACLAGLSIPTLLHKLRLDPKIAAGPLTLGLTDLLTLLFYFNLAKLLL